MQAKVYTYKKGWGGYYEVDSGMGIDDHISMMLSDGWGIQSEVGGGGRINVGRTALWTLATGGLGLIFGASREKEKIVVTYVKP